MKNLWFIDENKIQIVSMFPAMFGDIPRNVWQHSPEYLAIFPGIFGDIPRNVWGHSPKCLATFPGMFRDIPRNVTFPSFSAFPAFRSPFLYSCFYRWPLHNPVTAYETSFYVKHFCKICRKSLQIYFHNGVKWSKKIFVLPRVKTQVWHQFFFSLGWNWKFHLI